MTNLVEYISLTLWTDKLGTVRGDLVSKPQHQYPGYFIDDRELKRALQWCKLYGVRVIDQRCALWMWKD